MFALLQHKPMSLFKRLRGGLSFLTTSIPARMSRPVMTLRSHLVSLIRPAARSHPLLRASLLELDTRVALVKHVVAGTIPSIIQPRVQNLTVAITARCNLRCIGCRYGRDFMVGHSLSLQLVRDLLQDAKAAGVNWVRLYGGEPLLHPDLPKMIEHSTTLGLNTYVTTNGILLSNKIETLYNAGLRDITIGYYGIDEAYDHYVQRKKSFSHLESGVAAVRNRYGLSVDMQLNFLLMRPSCNLEALYAAWQFAERYNMAFKVDLIHYSLPYFTEGPDRQLQFKAEDRDRLAEITRELIRLKEAHPNRFRESALGIRSIPDWLLKGPGMRVPCDAYQLIWVGADGTVQLCYVTFKLGNLHERRLRDMLFTSEHRQSARDAFQLNCPNCHCGRDNRIQMHLASRLKYRSDRSAASGATPEAAIEVCELPTTDLES
jgi:molybdenum cofactor biosynthesis enzyme MoaA